MRWILTIFQLVIILAAVLFVWKKGRSNLSGKVRMVLITVVLLPTVLASEMKHQLILRRCSQSAIGFIQQSDAISAHIGRVRNHEISSRHFGATGGYGGAVFKLAVDGEKSTAVVYIEMHTDQILKGDWIVDKCRLRISGRPSTVWIVGGETSGTETARQP